MPGGFIVARRGDNGLRFVVALYVGGRGGCPAQPAPEPNLCDQTLQASPTGLVSVFLGGRLEGGDAATIATQEWPSAPASAPPSPDTQDTMTGVSLRAVAAVALVVACLSQAAHAGSSLRLEEEEAVWARDAGPIVAVSRSGRLTERLLNLPMKAAVVEGGKVPIVDPPHRVAGRVAVGGPRTPLDMPSPINKKMSSAPACFLSWQQ